MINILICIILVVSFPYYLVALEFYVYNISLISEIQGKSLFCVPYSINAKITTLQYAPKYTIYNFNKS